MGPCTHAQFCSTPLLTRPHCVVALVLCVQLYNEKTAAAARIQAAARGRMSRARLDDELSFQAFTGLDEDLERVSGLMEGVCMLSCDSVVWSHGQDCSHSVTLGRLCLLAAGLGARTQAGAGGPPR